MFKFTTQRKWFVYTKFVLCTSEMILCSDIERKKIVVNKIEISEIFFITVRKSINKNSRLN